MVVQDLTVAVADVNDRNPAFLLNDYFAEVHENLTFVGSMLILSNTMLLFIDQQGASVAQVTAIDQDFGVNDDVVYEIISGNLELNGNNSFAIDNETGVIYVNTNTLDRETYQRYMLTIRVMHIPYGCTLFHTNFINAHTHTGL